MTKGTYTFLSLAGWLLGSISLCSVSYAERVELNEDLSVGFSLRTRYEDKSGFRFDSSLPGDDESYFLSQARVNFQWTPADEWTFFAEGQDAAIQGEDFIDDNATPNIYSDDFDLHQGWVRYSAGENGDVFSVKVGRQKLNYGQQRLVGALEWVNTARVFDAAVVTLGFGEGRSLDIFGSRVVAVDPNDFNSWATSGSRYFDSDFHGAYYSDSTIIEAGQFELYWLFRRESDFDDSVHTVGTRFEAPIGFVDLDGEFAYQFGDFGDVDHSAYAAHLGGSVLLQEENSVRAGLAYNYGSGDDDPTDGDHETFDNLFPTNHAHYGYMDFFSLQNIHNLETTLNVNPTEDLLVRVAWQNFWLVEEDTDSWYNAGLGVVRNSGGMDVGSYVGNEIDITVKHPFFDKKLWLEAGYSHFFTGDFVEDTGNDEDADFFYLQAKVAIS